MLWTKIKKHTLVDDFVRHKAILSCQRSFDAVTASLFFHSKCVSSLKQVDVEDGHTLHLVARQPDLPPPGSLPNHSGLTWLCTVLSFAVVIDVEVMCSSLVGFIVKVSYFLL